MKKNSMIPFVVGKAVTELTIENTKDIWETVILKCNTTFSCDCKSHCHGCKQIAEPHVCPIARYRASMLIGAMLFECEPYMHSVLFDLFNFEFDSYYKP